MPKKLCVECGTPTEHVLLDTTQGKHQVLALCSACMSVRFGTPYNPQEDHPVKMPPSEVLDYVDCPECGGEGSLPLPVSRPEGSVLNPPTIGVRGGVMICQSCGAKVRFGVPVG